MSVRPEKVSDEELALKAKAGSRRSFEELMVRYSRRLSAFLGPKIASRQDVEDIVQQTFLNLFRRIGHYDPRWKFSTWAYTAAGRLAVTYYRTLAKAKKLEKATAGMPGAAGGPPARISGANLWETARALPPAQYQALWLFYAEEMSIREITRIMDKSSIAVRSLLHRGRMSLAVLVGGTGETEAFALNGPQPGAIAYFKENSG